MLRTWTDGEWTQSNVRRNLERIAFAVPTAAGAGHIRRYNSMRNACCLPDTDMHSAGTLGMGRTIFPITNIPRSNKELPTGICECFWRPLSRLEDLGRASAS